MKKEKIVPVDVSHCVPVYINGKIKYWNVHVFYGGDLSTNTEQREETHKITDESSKVFFEDFEMLKPVIKPNIIISELEYSWRDGLFGNGARRAWDFRLKMYSQIINNRNKER
ncbi:MAG: hypothetical protein MJ163_03055 [Alphaproteobacteria bacterium]|nr:hypothetical protein [Alphaproteobacteria bacterium]